MRRNEGRRKGARSLSTSAGTARRTRPRTQTAEELRGSLHLHMRRPVILLVVIAGALVQFGIEMWSAHEAPSASHLAGMFAVPPFDSFIWVHTPVGIGPFLVLSIVRALVVWLFICLVLEISPSKGALVRIGRIYALSVVVFAALFAALAWLGPILAALIGGLWPGATESDPHNVRAAVALGFVLLFGFLPAMMAAAVGVSPSLARAAADQALKPRFGQPCIWALVGLSAALYLPVAFGVQGASSPTPASFFWAFVLLSLQSLVFGAIVRYAADSSALRSLAGPGSSIHGEQPAPGPVG